MRRVGVVFKETRSGEAERTFAISLATQMNVPLDVFLSRPSFDHSGMFPEPSASIRQAELEVERRRILSRFTAPRLEVELRGRVLGDPRDTIFVSNEVDERSPLTQLRPFDECRVNVVYGRTVLVSFGHDWLNSRAADKGIQLAKKLGLTVTFYHTTYPREGVIADDAWHHMDGGAQDMLGRLLRQAHREDVRAISVTETAEEVATGIVHAALDHDASLIVMAYGRKVLKGSYVDQVASLGPVPLLVCASEEVSK